MPAENDQLRLAAQVFRLIDRHVYNAADLAGRFLPDLPQVLTQVVAVRLGDVTFFTGPGEIFPETLCGGYPGRAATRTPVIGDVAGHRVPPTCGEDGLPVEGGDLPCIIKPDAENPPDWERAPAGPYLYDLVPGEVPFFIGLGMDALGYIVPDYDFEGPTAMVEASGSHYEETNSMGPSMMGLYQTHVRAVLEAVEGEE